jgi:hypothetical protein
VPKLSSASAYSNQLVGRSCPGVECGAHTGNVRATLVLQGDGNLVLYHWAAGVGQTAVWNIGSEASVQVPRSDGPFELRLQPDGNLVAYNGANQPYWASNTGNHGAAAGPFTLVGLALYLCCGVYVCYVCVCACARARWRARVRIGLPCSVFLRVDMHARSNAHRSCIWKGNWSCTRETESLFGGMIRGMIALRTRRLRIRRSRLGHAVIRVQPRSLAL